MFKFNLVAAAVISLSTIVNADVSETVYEGGGDEREVFFLPNIYTEQEAELVAAIRDGAEISQDELDTIRDFYAYFQEQLERPDFPVEYRQNLTVLDQDFYPIEYFAAAKYNNFMQKTNAEFMAFYLTTVATAFIRDPGYSCENKFLFGWVESLAPLTSDYTNVGAAERAAHLAAQAQAQAQAQQYGASYAAPAA